jgi:hypothetical protein
VRLATERPRSRGEAFPAGMEQLVKAVAVKRSAGERGQQPESGGGLTSLVATCLSEGGRSWFVVLELVERCVISVESFFLYSAFEWKVVEGGRRSDALSPSPAFRGQAAAGCARTLTHGGLACPATESFSGWLLLVAMTHANNIAAGPSADLFQGLRV